jgi:hypothetical protein
MQIGKRKHFSVIFVEYFFHNSPLISYDPTKDGVNAYEHA